MYEWVNPPSGEYSIEEYLKMHEYWSGISSTDRNKLSVKADPLKKRFFGNKRVKIRQNSVILEDLC